MDSSNRQPDPDPDNISFFLGKLKKKVEPREWGLILDGVLRVCRPHLKYLSLYPIDDFLNPFLNGTSTMDIDTSFPHGWLRYTPNKVVEFCEGINGKTRCSIINALPATPISDPTAYRGVNIHRFIHIMLSQKGEIVVWDGEYREIQARILPPEFARRTYPSAIFEKAVRVRFSIIKTSELSGFLEFKPFLCEDILEKIQELIDEGVKKRTEVLASLSEVGAFVRGVQERTGTLH